MFLYSGPAINVLAIIMTARILGWRIGLARALGAVLFSLVIGFIMSKLFKSEEDERQKGFEVTDEEPGPRTLLQTGLCSPPLILILIFAAWAKPFETSGFFYAVFRIKWILTLSLVGCFIVMIKNGLRRRTRGMVGFVMGFWEESFAASVRRGICSRLILWEAGD